MKDIGFTKELPLLETLFVADCEVKITLIDKSEILIHSYNDYSFKIELKESPNILPFNFENFILLGRKARRWLLFKTKYLYEHSFRF